MVPFPKLEKSDLKLQRWRQGKGVALFLGFVTDGPMRSVLSWAGMLGSSDLTLEEEGEGEGNRLHILFWEILD